MRPLVAGALAALLLSTAQAAPVFRLPEGKTGCSQLVENFCDALWAPEALGNLELEAPDRKRVGAITLGKTPNETNYANTLFAEAQLAARSRVPEDLRQALEARGYFDKLALFVKHKPFAQMSQAEVRKYRETYGQIDAIASESLQNVATARVSKKHPGFFRLTDDHVPTAIAHAYSRSKDELESATWKAIWSGHPRLAKVREEFDAIREVLIELVREHPSVKPETKARWERRLRSVSLQIPGSDPVQLGDSERRCASTEMNGYHSIERNAVTICGGYILASDPARTLAHELAHSLGVRRSEFEARTELPVAKRLQQLREYTCKDSPYGETVAVHRKSPLFTCEEWAKWRKDFLSELAAPVVMHEQSDEFLSCFVGKKLKGETPAATLDYIAREWVQGQLEAQARRDRFIRLTKKTEILRDGTTHPSKAYMNPCGVYYIYSARDPYSSDFTLNTFFVNEYACQQQLDSSRCEKQPEKCLEAAIEGADELEYALRRRGLGLQTRYSSVRELQRQGYAEDIEEDLSDNLGQLAFTRYLEKRKTQAERRAKFLSTVASLCDEPSIAKLYPAEAQVQKKYYFDSHSEGLDRRRKLLIRPIREALGCEMDFERTFPECDWFHPQSPKSDSK